MAGSGITRGREKRLAAYSFPVATAESFGITGTPSFLLGKSTRDGVSGVILVGALPLDAFEAKLKELGL